MAGTSVYAVSSAAGGVERDGAAAAAAAYGVTEARGADGWVGGAGSAVAGAFGVSISGAAAGKTLTATTWLPFAIAAAARDGQETLWRR